MMSRGIHIRESVIPDISVKLLDLYLSEDENEFYLPRTQRVKGGLEYGADLVLQTHIKKCIEKDCSQTLPLVLRKKQLLEKISKTKEQPAESKKIEDLFTDKKVPIIMRKYLLYQHSRAS